MQFHHANTLERIEVIADRGHGEVAWPVTLDQLDFSTSNRKEIQALLAPSGHSKSRIWVVAVAVFGGFGSGWAGAWYGPAAVSAVYPIAQTETASRRVRDTNLGGKVESARKMPPRLSFAPKPPARASSAAQLADAIQADMTVTGSVQPTGPLLSLPETRPTTIVGWAVLDVRGGTAVIEGPDGIRMAARGDVVPGIGRIDSIVRWGNRWIVATAGGLISTR
ncbi:hypothetical protein FXB40_41870 [Bradyrhizobium rifense]|uniref:Uncharacterized protein n=1 Tax=Bradyrhizobium rifense TaxID=515499 RepID=A0A5D3K0N9_9BRAD|nr:hypothetical protein [Bradyrhizobium rifense]TYL86535.1 hypothetical protein FXB40_41870 [Bradyrhizobium rifense]